MTKKKIALSTIGALVAVSLAAISISGCAQPAAETPTAPAEEFTAPNMGTSADLAATDGTVPTAEADAIKLFDEVCSQLYWKLNPKDVERSVNREVPIAVEPTEGSDDLTREVPIGNGKAKIAGALTYSSTLPTSQTLTANTRYDSYRGRSVKGNCSITLDGLTFTDSDGVTYTVSGKATNKMDEYYKMDMLTGTDVTDLSDAKYYTDIGYKRTYGLAISIKASNGAGAKFIVSKNASYESKGVETTRRTSYIESLRAAMEDETATLSIYDDAGNLKFESSVPYGELMDLVPMRDLILGMRN